MHAQAAVKSTLTFTQIIIFASFAMYPIAIRVTTITSLNVIPAIWAIKTMEIPALYLTR